MFRHYGVVFRQLVFITSPSISIAAVGNFKDFIIMTFLNLNCITNSCNWNTYVTWRGNEYELPEDDNDSVETCRSVIIYKLIVIVLLLVILQDNIKCKI